MKAKCEGNCHDRRKTMAKVIVIVQNGCIQEVQADDPSIEVIVVDYDCMEENINSRVFDGQSADVWSATLNKITMDI